MKHGTTLLVLSLWLATGTGLAQGDIEGLIFPDPARKIIIVEATGKSDDLLTGRELSPSHPLAAAALRELALPFHASQIKLSQCARNLAGHRDGPNLLYLSSREGGFPRTGIRLTDSKGHTRDFPGLHFVDLVLDEARLDDGAMDIYTHELGHVMMNTLLREAFWDAAEGRVSPKQHVGMGITDIFTAFYEGWGIHFQRLGYDRVPRYRELFDGSHHYLRATGSAWHSNLDTELRIHGVLKNLFIHRRVLPAGVDPEGLTPEDRILLEHVSPLFDPTRIKNAQQMMASEGMIATLFYHIDSNPRLQANYTDRPFYQRFLLNPLPGEVRPRDLFTPEENIFLKHFWIWRRLAEKQPAGPPMIALIREWGDVFPEDREELFKLFLMLTRGRTVTDRLAGISEHMGFVGMIGDIQRFRAAFPGFQEAFQELLKTVLADSSRFSANLGPELWVTHPTVEIRSTLWSESKRSPLAINLNTAGLFELAAFIGHEQAERFLKKRDDLGFLRSLEQAAELGFDFKRP